MNSHEVFVLKAITRQKCYGFPYMIDHGTTTQQIDGLVQDDPAKDENDEKHFIVLQKLGTSIKRLIRIRKGPFTIKTVA